MRAEVVIWVIKIAAVIALLGIAAAIATPKGRLPLALRGLRKVLRGENAAPAPDAQPASTLRRVLAFLLVLLAAILCLV